MRKTVKKRHNRIWPWVVFFCLLAVSVTVALSCTVLFPVKTVQVYGSAYYEPEQLLQAVNITQKDKLFGLREATVLSRVQEQLPYIEGVEIHRHFPDTIEITFEDVTCLLAVEIPGQIRIVDRNLRICAGEPPLMPIAVRADWSMSSDNRSVTLTDSRQAEVIDELLEEAGAYHLLLDEIDVSNTDDIRLKTTDGFSVQIGGMVYLESKLAHLNGMIKNMKPGATGNVDLREWSPSNPKAYFVQSN